MAGKRNTLQKEIILHTVQSMFNHPSATMVYERVHKEHPAISRATVFRVLNQLADDGIIRKVEMTGGADCYDFHGEPHYHVRCAVCGEVADVKISLSESLDEEAREAVCGYQILGHSIIFHGICPKCGMKKTD